MVHWLRKFGALEPAERRLVLQIVTLLPVTALALRVFSFKRVCAALHWLAGPVGQAPSEDEAAYVERARQWIRFVKRRGPYHGNCLSRSLVLWWLLHRQGIQSVLRIGARKPMAKLQAHAWVEYRGQPLNAGPRVRQRYATFDLPIAPEALSQT